MIRIEITDPQEIDTPHLKALARFFMELTGEPMNSTTTIVGDVSITSNHEGEVFNAVELAESEQIAAAHAERTPDPKSVFGAPSTAVAAPSSIAPAAPPVTLTAPAAPVPPVPTTAPTGETVAPPTTGPAPDVDRNGLPWDGRIHSRTRAINSDGSWKKRRGIDDVTVAMIEGELRGVPQTTRVIDDGPGTPPAVPAPVVTPPVPASPVTIGFPQLLPKVTAAVAAGTLTQARVADVLAAHGLDSLPKLIARPDLVPVVHTELFGGQ